MCCAGYQRGCEDFTELFGVQFTPGSRQRFKVGTMTLFRSRHTATALLTAAALVLAACGGGSSEPAAETPAETPAPVEADAVEADEPDPADAEPVETDPSDAEPVTTDANGSDLSIDIRCAVKANAGDYSEIECSEPHDAQFAGFVSAPEGGNPIAQMSACGAPVELLTGRPMVEFGFDAGVASVDGSGDIECWAEVTAPGALTASLDVPGALGDNVFITDLEPGTCFLLSDPEGFDLATLPGCEAKGAEMIYGKFLADDGPAPDGAAVDDFFLQCDAIEADADFDLIGNSRYIISPLDDSWEAHDRRTILCITWTDPEADPEADLEADVTEQTRPTGLDSPFCATFDDELDTFLQASCDEPHNGEFAGFVTTADGALPDDASEASNLIKSLCREQVEALTGRSMLLHGVGIGFSSLGGLGEQLDSDIECYVSLEVEDGFIAAIGEVGLDAALMYSIIADLDPGTCFLFASDTAFDHGTVVPCATEDALMAVGSFVVTDAAGSPHPGDDALRVLRTDQCAAVLAASGLAADSATVSGTFPGEQSWTVFDRRIVTCDATPL